MVCRVISYLIVAATLTTSSLAAASSAQPEPLSRSGNWQINYEKDACNLLGQFGTGDGAVVVRFTRFAPYDSFQLSLYSKRFRSKFLDHDANISFSDSLKVDKTVAMFARTGDLPTFVISSVRIDGLRKLGSLQKELPPISPEQEASTDVLTVDLSENPKLRMRVGPLGKAMALLRVCTADLVKSWGYDPAVQANLSQQLIPATYPGDWIRSEDFPEAAARSGGSGWVRFRLDVDETGHVQGCRVLSVTDGPDYQTTTCTKLMLRARFKPALDQQGRPTKAFYVNEVRWMNENGKYVHKSSAPSSTSPAQPGTR